MNVDKPVFSTEMARHWAAVRTLTRNITEGLAEQVDSEAEDGCGEGLCCNDELLHAISSLSKSLVAMFDIEESEACRDQILCDCPELSDRLDVLYREHDPLAGSLAVIEELCVSDERVSSWSDVERRFCDFVRAWTAHEQREAAFIQNAFTVDVGVGD